MKQLLFHCLTNERLIITIVSLFFVGCSRDAEEVSLKVEFYKNLGVLSEKENSHNPKIAESAIEDSIALCKKYKTEIRGVDMQYIIGMSYGRLAFIQQKLGKETERELSLSRALESLQDCRTVDGITTREKAMELFRTFEEGWEKN